MTTTWTSCLSQTTIRRRCQHQLRLSCSSTSGTCVTAPVTKHRPSTSASVSSVRPCSRGRCLIRWRARAHRRHAGHARRFAAEEIRRSDGVYYASR